MSLRPGLPDVACKSVLALAVASYLGACRGDENLNSVTVEKAVPQIENKVFKPKPIKTGVGAAKSDPLAMDVEANTEWFYSCKANIVTEDVRSDDTSGGATLALKVKAVKFDLALPMTLNLPLNASAELREHEAGHIQICSLVYGLAGKVAADAGKQIIGKTYEGMGKNVAEARAMALSQAQRVVARAYQEGTNDVAEQVSRKYDQLCQRYYDEPKISRASLAASAYREIVESPVIQIK